VGPILSYKTELAMLVVSQCMQIAVPWGNWLTLIWYHIAMLVRFLT
jgi:hypothetical protein